VSNLRDSFDEYESIQCIWMSSNLVKYKLCDNKFDCDKCLFDKVMRNIKSEIDEFLKQPEHAQINNDVVSCSIQKIKDTEYTNSLIYLKNNLVLKKLFNDTYYLGFNPIAYILMDNISGYNYCRDNKNKRIGEPLVQFTGDWGSISVPSPINFFCLGRLKPELDDLQLNSWFSLISTEEEEVAGAQIFEEEFNFIKNETIEIINSSQIIFPNLGTTMNDGGEKVKHLYQAIGQLNYYTILKRLFNL
jgi:hypothetical protein